jgi:hypothetical protein
VIVNLDVTVVRAFCRAARRPRPRHGHCQPGAIPWRCCWRSYRRFNRLPSSSALSHRMASLTRVRRLGARGAHWRRRSGSPVGGFTSPGSMYFSPSSNSRTNGSVTQTCRTGAYPVSCHPGDHDAVRGASWSGSRERSTAARGFQRFTVDVKMDVKWVFGDFAWLKSGRRKCKK